MKYSIFLSCTRLLVVHLILVPFIRSHDLINITCKKTPYYDLCVSTLQSTSQSSNTDVKDLASIMSNLTLSDSTEILSYLQKLIEENMDPHLQRPLSYCAEVYIPVVDYILPQAIDALLKGQFGFARYGILDSEGEAQACEKKIPGSVKFPMHEMIRDMQKLCNVSVAIIDILLKG